MFWRVIVMENYVGKFNKLIRNNKKRECYDIVLKLSNEALKLVTETGDMELLLQFNNLLNIIEEAMEIDDIVVILDIIQYEFSNYIEI